MRMRWIAGWMAVGALWSAVGEEIRLEEDAARVALYRGGAIVEDALAANGRSAQVGRDWSLSWFMEPTRATGIQLEREMEYDLWVRARGHFKMGLYSGGVSAFLAPYRELELPVDGWSDVLVGRFRLDAQDYLTTDGVEGASGWIDSIRLVPHPLGEAEKAGEKMAAVAHLDFDGSAPLRSIWRLHAVEPVQVEILLPQDEFCPEPEAELTVRRENGEESLALTRGSSRLELAASRENPIVELTVKTAGVGRTIFGMTVLNPISEKFLTFGVDNEFAQYNTFDQAQLSDNTHRLIERSCYLAACKARLNGRAFAAIPESPMRKVFEYQLPPDNSVELDLALARNEAENAQLVIVPGGDAPMDLTWTLEWDTPAPEGMSVAFAQAGYVYLRPKAYAQLREHGNYYPDVLLPLSENRLKTTGRNVPLWLTVKAGESTPAGSYRGKLRLSGGESSVEVPLTVRVYDFSIPQEPSIRTCFFLQRPSLIDFFGITSWEEERAFSRKVIELAAANRLTLMPMLEHVPRRIAPLWEAFQEADGSFSFDFSKENELTAMILDEFHGTGYNVAPSPTFAQYLGYIEVTERATGKRSKLNYAVGSPEFRRLYGDFLRAAWRNAVEHGWADKAYHYIWDEWHGDTWNSLHEMSKEFVPDLPVLAVGYDTSDMTPKAFESIDIWVPLTSAYTPEFALERRQAGDEMWAYVCVSPKNQYNLFIDHQGFSHRALCWWSEERELDGLLYWGVNYWAQAAELRAAGAVWPETDWQANQFVDANGDGYLMYPDAASGAIYGSIRLSLLRDGLEDIEYFRLLKDLLARNAVPSEAWRQQALAVLAAAPEVTARESQGVAKNDDSELLEQLRRRLGALLEEALR